MKLALLGTGLLGSAVAERLLGFGHELSVWNRTRKKTGPLVKAGARAAKNPAAAMETAEGVILFLADAGAIRKTLFSAAARRRLAGRTFLQMGTISPEESCALEKLVKKFGGEYLEAPVLGSLSEAKSGTLQVMAGATPEQFEQWQPMFRQLSEEPLLAGPVGKASALKLALNQLIASQIAAFGLSLAIVQSHSVDVGLFMKILRKSALYALTFDKKMPRLLERNYKDPNFPAKHMLKDVELILRDARRKKLDASGLAGIRKILQATVRKGHAKDDYSAVMEIIRGKKRQAG